MELMTHLARKMRFLKKIPVIEREAVIYNKCVSYFLLYGSYERKIPTSR
jgi:hypothetical protein